MTDQRLGFVLVTPSWCLHALTSALLLPACCAAGDSAWTQEKEKLQNLANDLTLTVRRRAVQAAAPPPQAAARRPPPVDGHRHGLNSPCSRPHPFLPSQVAKVRDTIPWKRYAEMEQIIKNILDMAGAWYQVREATRTAYCLGFH